MFKIQVLKEINKRWSFTKIIQRKLLDMEEARGIFYRTLVEIWVVV
jgi:hypothetical protein